MTTIDWSKIVIERSEKLGFENNDDDEDGGGQRRSDETGIKTNLINRNCVGQICHRSKHCWSDRVPQIECSRECSAQNNGCNLDAPDQCCSLQRSDCLFCVNSTNK